jgi:hypothetical protein
MDRITMKAGWNDPIVSVGGLEGADRLRNGRMLDDASVDGRMRVD